MTILFLIPCLFAISIILDLCRKQKMVTPKERLAYRLKILPDDERLDGVEDLLFDSEMNYISSFEELEEYLIVARGTTVF